jgi:hypothetical protein
VIAVLFARSLVLAVAVIAPSLFSAAI